MARGAKRTIDQGATATAEGSTKTPAPTRLRSGNRSARASRAARTVMRDTPNIAASCRSGGRRNRRSPRSGASRTPASSRSANCR